MQVPMICKNCGRVSLSAFFIGYPTQIAVLDGNLQNCPHCDANAEIASGVFSFTADAVKVLQAPEITIEMLRRFGVLVVETYAGRSTLEELQTAAAAIDPKLAAVVATARSTNYVTAALLILLVGISQCVNINVSLDANKLLEQIVQEPPAALIEKLRSAEPKDGGKQTNGDHRADPTGKGAEGEDEPITQPHPGHLLGPTRV